MAEADAEDVWQAARKRFGENLGLLRRAAGVKQGPLAGHLSVSVSTVSALEQGVGAQPPDAELVERYVDYCLKRTKASQAVKEGKAWAVRDAREKLDELHEHLHDLPGRRRGGATVSTLRRDVRAFTGREDELAVLVEAVERRKQGLIAVYAVDGMPGVGKTAFATHAAHQLAPQFPDGQLFVDLHGHSPVRSPVDPGEALTSLLTAVGVDPLAVPADLDSRSALWRTRLRGKRVLLVLDNAADHTQVEPLLPGEGQCLVLVTSRRRLVELDAVPIDLNPLTTDEAEKMFLDLATRPAELELEAAPEDMTRLAELCGRLPLAIAIVAARFRNRGTLTVARLVEELTEARNRLLALRARDRAVAAAFELSYRDLLPDRQLFFRRLGLHPGEDVERYGAMALCGVELIDADEHLDALYHEHLVEEIDYGRYRLHDLIAEYTRDLLSRDEPEPTAAALESMLDFYQQTAGIAADLLMYGDRDGDPWFPGAVPPLADAQAAMDWCEHERANLLACLEIVEEPGRVVGFALALAPYLRRTGPWDLTLRLLRRAVEAAPATGDDTATGMTLLELGKAEFYADNYEGAQVALRAAGRVFAALGDDTCLAQAMSTLGQVWVQTGDHGDARSAYAQALAAHEKVGNRRLAAGVLVELGTLHYFEDEYAESVTANERALRIYEEVGDRDGQATALKGLGHAWLFSDDYERAHDAATRARELFRQARQRLGEAQTSSLLGSVGRARGQYPKAKEDFEQALEIYDELGDRAGAAMAKIELGIVLHHLGDFAAGERTLREALELYEEFGEPMGQASVCKELADLLTRTNRLPEARELLDEAEAIYEKLDDRLGKAGTSNSYGAWYLASGEPRTARSRHNEALRLALEIASPTEKASALAGLGRVARALGEHEAAERSFWDAYEIYLRIGSGEAADLARELGVDVTPSDEDEGTEGAGSGAAAH